MRTGLATLISLACVLWASQASAQSADLLISKSGPESATAGDTITYSVFIFNSGPDTAQNVTVTDPLPSGTTFFSMNASDATFTCSTPAVGSGGIVSCTAPSFPLEGSVSFTLSVKTSTNAPTGSISNTATIASNTTDPEASNNSSTQTTGIIGNTAASADLSIDAFNGVPTASAAATMSVQVAIANKGPSTAHHVRLAGDVPANTTFAAVNIADSLGDFACITPAVGATGTITCSALSFDQRSASDQPVFTFTFRINDGVAAGTMITNSATLSSDEADPISGNNSANHTTTVTSQSPAADVSVAVSGGNSAFTVTVRNSGPNDAASVMLTNAVPASSTFATWTQNTGPNFNCVTPPAGGTGTITCTIGLLPAIAGQTTTAEFALTIDPSPPSAQVTDTASVSSSTTDPRPDNNTASFPVLSALSIDDVSVVEGNSGTTPAVFTVRLQPANATLTATATYRITGITATPGVDFLASDGTLTFLAGETQKTITVQVVGDAQKESNETFSVQIVDSVNARIDHGTAIGTIVDDDQFAPTLPTLSIANVSVPEGNSGMTNATFTAQLSFAPAVVSRVRWQTLNGTATAGSDYVASSGELVFQPGEVSKSFTVPIIGDTNFEPDETFTIVITGADNVLVPSGLTVTGTIVNDDPQVPPRHRAARP